MISAKQAKEKCKIRKAIIPKIEKLLECNRNKQYYISLPFTLKAVEETVEEAINKGETNCKFYNEITNEAERVLIDNGYKVVWYKNFIKVSWQ